MNTYNPCSGDMALTRASGITGFLSFLVKTSDGRQAQVILFEKRVHSPAIGRPASVNDTL